MHRRLGLTVATSIAFAALGGTAGAGGLPPLRGSKLEGPTGLRLVLATEPPSILDVDAGSVTPVSGAGPPRAGGLWVMPSKRANVAGTSIEGSRSQALVIHSDGTAQRGVRGMSVLAANSSRGTWVLDPRAQEGAASVPYRAARRAFRCRAASRLRTTTRAC